MFIKYLVDKSIKLWDEYLSQGLFTIRIQVYNILKDSPYYLLYIQHHYLPSGNNLF